MQNLKNNCGLENHMRNLAKFSPEYTKFSKLGLSLDPLIQSRKCMSLMKNDAKFEIKLTCHFKIDMRNLTNFDTSI